MIDQNDIEQLKEIFVTRTDCKTTEEHLVEKLSGEIQEMRIENVAVKTRLNVLIGILSVISVPIAAMAINLLFGR